MDKRNISKKNKVFIFVAIVTGIIILLYIIIPYLTITKPPETYIQSKEYEKAIRGYTVAIIKDPQNSTPRYNRGVVYMTMGKYKEALEDFTKAIELNPGNVAYYQNKAMVHFYLQEYEEAIKINTKALQLQPNNGMLYFNRARAYYMKNDKVNALKDFKEAYLLGIESAKNYIKILSE